MGPLEFPGMIWTFAGLVGVALCGTALGLEIDRRRRGGANKAGTIAWLGLCGAAMLEAYAVVSGEWVLMIAGLLLPMYQAAYFFSSRATPKTTQPTAQRGRSLPNVAPQQAEQKSAIVPIKSVAQANPAPPAKSKDSNKK